MAVHLIGKNRAHLPREPHSAGEDMVAATEPVRGQVMHRGHTNREWRCMLGHQSPALPIQLLGFRTLTSVWS